MATCQGARLKKLTCVLLAKKKDMHKEKILRKNIIFSVIQMTATVVLLFGFYRYLAKVLTLSEFGIWATLVAIVSFSKISDMGLTAGISRFVAIELARGSRSQVSILLNTIIVFSLLIILTLAAIVFPFLDALLSLLYEDKFVKIANALIPYVFINFLLTVASSSHLSALDGAQKTDIRAKLAVLGLIVWVIISVILIPIYGLLGLAMAQIFQSLLLLLLSRYIFYKKVIDMSYLNLTCHFPVLKGLVGYSVNLQITSIFSFLFEPMVKILLTKFSGPAAAGIYEIGNQVVSRARGIIISGNQAIVPFMVNQVELGEEKFDNFFIDNFKIVFYLSLFLCVNLVTSSQTISIFMLGEVSGVFVTLVQLLALGTFFNMLSGPSYFANMVDEQIIKNTISHIAGAVIIITTGLYFGELFGVEGIYCSIFFAILLPAIYIIYDFFRKKNIRISDVLGSRDYLTCVLVCLSGLTYQILIPYSLIMELLILPTVYVTVFFLNRDFRSYFSKHVINNLI